MFSKEAISQRVSDLKRLHQKTTEWKISALEAADSMKETVAIAFMSEDDAGALEMIEAMVKKQGEPSFLMHCSQEKVAWQNSNLPKKSWTSSLETIKRIPFIPI